MNLLNRSRERVAPPRSTLRSRRPRRPGLERLENRLAPAGLLNGGFTIADPADPGYGWSTRGNVAIGNGQGVLTEGATLQAEISQTFTIPQNTTALRFVLVGNGLASNGAGNPRDAFEAALIDTQTNQPLVGPPTGLNTTDSFLNIQQTGEVFYAPGVTVPGAGASGAAASLVYPELVTVNLPPLAADTQATLFFDLVGILPAGSSFRVTDVALVTGSEAPALTLLLDPATDSGAIGDDLTSAGAVNLIGTTDPNQTVRLDVDGDGFDDGTATADSTGHFQFTAVPLSEGGTTFRAQATNAQGTSIATRTITRDSQPPAGTLVDPSPGSTTSGDLGYVDVRWTDSGAAGIDPATFDVNDVTVSGVTIDQVQDLGGGLMRYRYNLDGDTLSPGTITVGLPGGQVADRAGNQNAQAAFAFTFQLAPTATPQAVTAQQDAPAAITLAGTDANTPALPLTFTVTSGPSHGVLSGTAPDLMYVPEAGYHGPDSFQFQASNGLFNSPPATVAITVIGKPAADPRSLAIPQDTFTPITLTGSDPNTPPLALSFTVTTDPSHGTLTGTAPDVSYMPAPDYIGPDSFTFTVTNGTITSDPVIVALRVIGRPSAAARSVTTPQGVPLDITLGGSDPNDPALPLTYLVIDGPAHGTLSGTAPQLRYTPDPAYSGPDSLRFQVSNGTIDSGPATVAITVEPAVAAPVAHDDAYAVPPGQTLAVPAPGVLQNDSSPGGPLAAALLSPPAHGVLSLHADGSFRYQPAPGFTGADAFTYQAVAGSTPGGAGTVRITVQPAAASLLPRTRFYQYVRNRRAIDPDRFAFYHPELAVFLRLEQTGLPAGPTVLLAANGRFDAAAARASFRKDPAGYAARHPVRGAVLQLESGADALGGALLLPSTRRFAQFRSAFARDPVAFGKRHPSFGAILTLEQRLATGRP